MVPKWLNLCVFFANGVALLLLLLLIASIPPPRVGLQGHLHTAAPPELRSERRWGISAKGQDEHDVYNTWARVEKLIPFQKKFPV